MKFKKKYINTHYSGYFLISIIIAVFLFYRILTTIKYPGVCYDCSIYLSQAKYIYSLGASGYFEPLRPLVLPIILGIGWVLGLDISVFGTVTSVLFSAALIFIVYLICKEMGSRPAGLAASFLICITPIYFFNSGQILTDIPSTFFALLSFYFFVKKKYSWTGIFAAVAFMARFPQGVLLISYTLVFFANFIVSRKFKQASKDYTKFLIPYFIIVLAYLIFNAFKYSSADTLAEAMFWPFVHGTTTIAKAGLWIYQGDVFYYFVNLLSGNYLFILALPFIFFYFSEKKYKQQNYNFLLFSLLLLLLYFMQLPHKELRFAIVFLPYLAMASGFGFARLCSFLEKIVVIVLVLAVVVSVFMYPKISLQEITPPSGKPVCDFINSHNITGLLIITTPYVMPCVDNKLEANFFSPPLLVETMKNNPESIVVYSSDSYLCPENDNECQKQIQEALSYLETDYNLIFFDRQDPYKFYVFKKK